jgi:hypothetical protein
MLQINTANESPAHPTGRWLLLMPYIGDAGPSVRVQVWRLLTRAGAVLARHGVWLLPATPDQHARARGLVREVEAVHAQCALCAASMIDGLGDAEVESLFRDARSADFAALTADADRLMQRQARPEGTRARATLRRSLDALERRLAELRAITFVPTPVLRDAELAITTVRGLAHGIDQRWTDAASPLRARTWVTRRGVFVDRISSAWLIRRFIDPTAIFRFIDPAVDESLPGELRFDIRGGEYGHEDDRCTFETLCLRFALTEAGHRGIGEMVHDLDCREQRFNRPETAGFLRILEGIAAETVDDQQRIDRASPLLDSLFRGFATDAARSSHSLQPSP